MIKPLFIGLSLCGLYVLPGIESREVILSSGLGDWNRSQLTDQFNAFTSYHKMGIISANSILVYNLDESGNLGVYNTSDPEITAEKYQTMIKNIGLKSYPCLYCDATIGNCQSLGDRLTNLYAHQQDFIDSTIRKLNENQWDGMTVDFEPDQPVDVNRLTDFVVEWGRQFKQNNKTLYVWIGGSGYNMSTLYSTNNLKLLTMDTYVDNYDSFTQIASESLTRINDSSLLGFGLLTSEVKNNTHITNNISENSVIKIGRWARLTETDSLSIWASNIPPRWYMGLKEYLSGKG